jgi:hypothetical protein
VPSNAAPPDGPEHSDSTEHPDSTAHSDSTEHPDSTAHSDSTEHPDGTEHSEEPRRRKHRRVTTKAVPGTDQEPQKEPPRHEGGENDERLRQDKPPHWG